MTLSTTAAFDAAFLRSGAKVTYLVDIYDGTTHWAAITRSVAATSDLRDSDHPEGVVSVEPVGTELDPFTRVTRIGEVFVSLHDAWIRPIIVNNRIAGQKLTVKIGEASLDEADYVEFFTGPISEVLPRDDGSVAISSLDPMAILDSNKITGYWLNKNPLEILYLGDGSGVLEKGGLTSFNTASFDPSNYTDDIGHLILSRLDSKLNGAWAQYVGDETGRTADWGGINKPISALRLANEIVQLLNGQLVIDEDGSIAFKRFDASAATVDSWDDDDILPGTFEQKALDSNIVNRLIATFGRDPDGNHKHTYQVDDSDSQTAYAYPGASIRVLAKSLVTNWLDSHFYFSGAIDAVATSATLFRAELHAMSGNRSDGFAAISATQPLWLLLDSSHISGNGNVEIVSVTSITRNTGAIGAVQVLDPADGTWHHEEGWVGNISLNTINRAQLGTTASAHENSQTWVYDITPLVILFDELLARFKYGAPIVEFQTLMTKYKYQTGDMIALTKKQFLAYGLDGLSDEKFEIVGKEPRTFEGEPSIAWVLAHAGDEAVTRVAHAQFGRGTRGAMALAQTLYQSVTQVFVEFGLVISDEGGRDIEISAGSLSNGTFRQSIAEVTSRNLPATMDTYIRINVDTASMIFDSVAVGAGEPDYPNDEVQLGWVTTSAVDITALDGVRTLHPFDSLDLIESRSLDDIQDGSTYRRLVGVDAAHLAQEASLDTGVVTETKLATGSVVEAKLGALAVTEDKLAALAVTEAKLGTGAVVEAKLGSLAVTTAKLDTGSVVEAKLGSLSVTEAKLGTLAVTAAKIGANAVTSLKIAKASIGTHQTVSSAKLAIRNDDFSMWTRG